MPRLSGLPHHIFYILMMLCMSCASDNTAHYKDAAVAVWDLDNLTPSASAQSDLGELLSAQVIEAIQSKGDYTVVERERLLLALQELRLGTEAIADESTRLKLGRISGATLMVFGAYQVIGEQMRLDLRLVEVETGKVQKAVQRTTPATDLSGWHRNAREVAGELF